MTNQELINKLKTLKEIQPDTGWLKASRERLIEQTANQKVSSRQNETAEVFYFTRLIRQMSKDFVLRPIGTFAIMLILVLGGGVLKVKADSSLPGDFLYSLKKGGEKIQIILARHEEEKVKLQLEFTDRHLDELAQIAEQSNFSTSEKEQRLIESINIFQSDLAYLKDNLKSAESKGDAANTIEVAKKVDEKVNLYQFVLNQTQRKVASKQIKAEVGKVINDINETDTKALTVIANKHQEAQDSISSQEIALRIEGNIKKASDEIDQLSQTLTNASGNGKITEAKNSSQKAQQILEQAKEDVANNEFIIAMEKIKTSKEIFNEAKGYASETTTAVPTSTSTENNVSTGLIKGESINVLTSTSSEPVSSISPSDPDLPAQTPQTFK